MCESNPRESHVLPLVIAIEAGALGRRWGEDVEPEPGRHAEADRRDKRSSLKASLSRSVWACSVAQGRRVRQADAWDKGSGAGRLRLICVSDAATPARRQPPSSLRNGPRRRCLGTGAWSSVFKARATSSPYAGLRPAVLLGFERVMQSMQTSRAGPPHNPSSASNSIVRLRISCWNICSKVIIHASLTGRCSSVGMSRQNQSGYSNQVRPGRAVIWSRRHDLLYLET